MSRGAVFRRSTTRPRRRRWAGPAFAAPDPIGKAGCKLWLDVRTASDGSTTTTWTDSSLTGNDITNGSSVVTHETVEINSLAVERFASGTNSWLQKASAAGLASPWTLAFVHRPSSLAATHTPAHFGNQTTDGPHIVLDSDDLLKVFQFNGLQAASSLTALSTGTVYVHVITCDGSGNVLIYRTGNVDDTTGATARTFAYTTPVFQLGSGGTAHDEGYAGDIGEVVYYDSVVSSGERTDLFDYLETRWLAGIVDVDGTRPVTATLTGTAAVDRTVQGNRDTTATLTGTTSVDHTVSGDRPITAAITGTIDVVPPAVEVDGNRPVTATITGTLAVDHTVNGSLAVTASRTGTAAVDRMVDGTRPVTATATGTAAVTRTVDGTRPVTATITGSIDVIQPGQVNINGDRTITATLTGTAAATHVVDGIRAVTATMTGTAQLIAGIQGNRPVTATITGSIDVAAPYLPATVGIDHPGSVTTAADGGGSATIPEGQGSITGMVG